jgi:hypothetical protein
VSKKVGVGDGVSVGVLVAVGECVAVGVGVLVGVGVAVKVGVTVGPNVIRKLPELSAKPKIVARHAQISMTPTMMMQALARHLPEPRRAGADGRGTGWSGADIRATLLIGCGAPQRAQNLASGLFSNSQWTHLPEGKGLAG